jgi:hypothetical protein
MNATRPERLGEIDKAAAEFEGEIRAFVRRDVSVWRKRGEVVAAESETAVANIDTLLHRVSGVTVEEIDRVIAELQTLRGTLTAEGERIRREITGFAGLSQTAITSLKIIADSLTQLNPAAAAPEPIAPRQDSTRSRGRGDGGDRHRRRSVRHPPVHVADHDQPSDDRHRGRDAAVRHSEKFQAGLVGHRHLLDPPLHERAVDDFVPAPIPAR